MTEPTSVRPGPTEGSPASPRRRGGQADRASGAAAVSGIARIDRRTKDLAKRIRPGEIAVIDHTDLDTVATESLIEAGVAAVVNASACISGRYPNVGPLLLPAAGIPVVDGVGSEIMEAVADGTQLSIVGGDLLVDDELMGKGTVQTMDSLTATLEESRAAMGDELERFASNTLEYLRREGHLLVDDPDVPDIPVDFRGRQALIVVRGVDYKKDLELLERSGYVREQRPILMGVDGGADAILAMGKVPDVILGDMDSVWRRRCAAER